MHRFFAIPDSFGPETVELAESETRHLRDVLRLRVGDTIQVFNGIGNEYRCVIVTITKTSARLRMVAEVAPTAPESPLDLTVAAAVTPADRFDLAIQKSVELGVTRFIPLITARCEVKAKDAERRLERWRRIAFEAAKQCGRARLMSVEKVSPFGRLIDHSVGRTALFSERSGVGFDGFELTEKKMIAMYGPKGGWTDEELVQAQAGGAHLITFGGRILRAETAAIAITAILQHRFGDMN